MVAIDAGCHKRLNLLKDLKKTKQRVRDLVTIIFPAYAFSCPYLFLCGLRLEDLVQFEDATLPFVQHIERGLVVGVRGHHHRLALLMLVLHQHRLHTTQYANVAFKPEGPVNDTDFIFCNQFFTSSLHTFKFHQLLVVLPAQCDLLPIFLQEIFVGFRHLTDRC